MPAVNVAEFASRGATPPLRTGNLDKVLVLMLFVNV